MYELLNAHPMTWNIIVGSVMVTPVYLLATYVFSGASPKKGLGAGLAFLVFGALMSWICVSDTPGQLGLAGNLIVPAAWILPSLLLYLGRDWFLARPLSQRWLVGLQLFRAIGGVFLIEMARGNLPGIFAYPAGLGDLAVSLVALIVLVRYARADSIPGVAVWAVIGLGVIDFLSAFFFGFTSSDTPLQLFHPTTPNQVLAFPTGMIPLFLVPYAIFFHTLSALQYFKQRRALGRRSGEPRETSTPAGTSIEARGASRAPHRQSRAGAHPVALGIFGFTLVVGAATGALAEESSRGLTPSWRVQTAAGVTNTSRQDGDGTSLQGSARFLLGVGGGRRFGVEMAYLDALADKDSNLEYGAVGIVLEQSLKRSLLLSIGTLGYFGLGDNEGNPFGIVSMIAWEPPRGRLYLGLRTELIFDDPSTRINSLVLGTRF